jgi:4-hydroxy-3-methylbut-2-en-1-yl diphosphate synthase IspG/GcpE
MTAIPLGVPEVPVRPIAERRVSRQIHVGPVTVGGGAPVSVQSMTTTRTSDIGATLQQIAELTASGCQIVRVACPTQDDADALATIARKSQIPVIADIHFQPKYVFAAIEAGCAAVRVNPGNIKKFDDQEKEIARAAKDHGTPIRIGVPWSLAAAAISLTLSSNFLMLPGLTRTAAQPASIAANTYLGWKWMSAITGIGDFRAMSRSASASSWLGTATRTIWQPAAVSSAICCSVALTSAVRVVVIDWTEIGWSLPTPTLPTWI